MDAKPEAREEPVRPAGTTGRRLTARPLVASLLLAASMAAHPGLSPAEGWSLQNSTVGVELFEVDMIDPLKAICAGEGGTIVQTEDGGEVWTQRYAGASNDLFGISAVGSGLGLAVGASGTITRTTDAGQSWEVIRADWMDTFRDVHLLDDQYAIAVGSNPIFQPWVAVSRNGGLEWDFYSFYIEGNEGGLTGVCAVDEQTSFASAYLWDGRGAVVKSVDGGASWSPVLLTPSSLFSVHFPSPDLGYASGFSGRVYRTTDAGSTWTLHMNGTTSAGFDLFFPDTPVGWVVGEFGLVARTTDSGENWAVQNLVSATLNGVDFATPLDGLACGQYGIILRTDTAGRIRRTWRFRTIPRDPSVCESAAPTRSRRRPRSPTGSRRREWSVSMWSTPRGAPCTAKPLRGWRPESTSGGGTAGTPPAAVSPAACTGAG